jgi:uncharacterized protein YceH (UPF0502 family)
MEPDAVEIRVLGCLIEKQHTTPDVYPLTLNALRLACNQSTNRDPVVDYDENTIRSGIERLVQRKWATLASWSNRRSMKYRHTLDGALGLSEPEISLLAVLMLRGAQTPGELKARTERLHPFGDMDELGGTLDGLIERRLAARLDRRPGQREERFRHLLVEEAEEAEEAAEAPGAPGLPEPAPAPAPVAGESEDRMERIERQLAELRSEIQALREELGT